MEGVYESVKGVEEVISGYSGGKEANPTYEQVGAHQTGHAESVEVYYNPSVVSYAILISVLFSCLFRVTMLKLLKTCHAAKQKGTGVPDAINSSTVERKVNIRTILYS